MACLMVLAVMVPTCVFPDGLEVEKVEIEANQPPRVVPGSQIPDPLKSLILSRDPSDMGRPFSLLLTDPNRSDTLYVRMFVDYHLGNTAIHRQDRSEPPTDPAVPRNRLEFAGLNCVALNVRDDPAGGAAGAPGTGQQHLLELVISDREFDDAGGAPVNRKPRADAFVATATWVFECSE